MSECPNCGREFDTEKGMKIHRTTADCDEAQYADKDTLEQLYWGEGLSLRKIADELDTTLDKVVYWMDVHSIETRTGYTEQLHAPFRMDKQGYEIWKTYVSGTHRRVRIHRLLAVAEYGFESVKDKEVHHKNGVKWDNRAENIEPISTTEHRRLHGLERSDEQRELMHELREKGKLKQ